MLVLACCGCGGLQEPVGPREAPVALWSERWDNGRAKREYQYYLDAWGAIVRHGYYREYSRFVDRLLTVEERYIAGTWVGPRYARCGAMAALLDYANGDFEFGSFDGWSLEGARANSIRLVTDAGRGRFSAKLTLQPGDMVRGGNRVELVRRDSADYLGERIYSWSFKIDAGYEEEPIDELVDLGIDTIAYAVSDCSVLLYATKVGERWGHNVDLTDHAAVSSGE